MAQPQIPDTSKNIEYLIYVLAVIQFFISISLAMGRSMFTRTVTDIKQLFDFHNDRERKCAECKEKTIKQLYQLNSEGQNKFTALGERVAKLEGNK